MIRKVAIKNFMTLRDAEISLDPLTIFVGHNASGKSATFKALVVLSRLLNGFPVRGPKNEEFALEPGVSFDDLVWKGDSSLPIKFVVWMDEDPDEAPSYTLEIARRAEGWSVIHERLRVPTGWVEVTESQGFEHDSERKGRRSYRPPMRAALRYFVKPFEGDSAARAQIEPILKMSELIGQTFRYRPSASDIASFVSVSPEDRARFHVRQNGWGVALALQDLQGTDRDTFANIEKALAKQFPHIQGIGIRSDWRGVRLSFISSRTQDPLPAPQESDGVLLTTFLLWRLFTAPANMRLCIEEPENGIHPEILGARFELLQKFSKPSQGLQVLVSTHSGKLLRTIMSHPSTLAKELRVVEFDQRRGTTVRCVADYRESKGLWEKYAMGSSK